MGPSAETAVDSFQRGLLRVSGFLRTSCRKQLLILAIAVRLLFFQASLYAQNSTANTKPSADQIPNHADQIALERALAVYDQGRAQQAEPALRDLVHRYPGNFAATETLGLIYAESGNFTSALPLLEKACRLRPSSPLGLANLGAILLKTNRIPEAVKALQRSLSLDPKNPETQSSLGQALLEAGNAAQAAAAFSAAAAGKPGDANITYNWALALFNAGKFKEAGEVLDRHPAKESSAEAQSLLADIEEKRGHYEAAVEHFKAAAEIDPSETNLYALGIEFMRHWTFPAAIKVYEFATSKYPSSTRLQLGLGVAEYGNNDYARAIPVFADLLSAAPDNALYADLLGRSCMALSEQQNQACESLLTFALSHPKNAAAGIFAAANILRRPQVQEDAGLARRLLEQAIAANPNIPEAYFQMAVLDQQQIQWQESATVLEKAIALRTEYAQAHYRLARAYRHLGRKEEAQREAELSQKYSEQEKNVLNARLKEVTTFLVTLK